MQLVLLDRDGVINRPGPHRWVMDPKDMVLLPGAAQAIAALNKAGIPVAVVTNQSAIGQELLTPQALDAIHQRMHRDLALEEAHVDAIYVCPDHPDQPTHRRKPNPGMLLEAMNDFMGPVSLRSLARDANYPPDKVSAAPPPFIGDSLTDVQAAVAAGCTPYLVMTGHGQHDKAKVNELYPSVPCYPSLWHVVASFGLLPKSAEPSPQALGLGG